MAKLSQSLPIFWRLKNKRKNLLVRYLEKNNIWRLIESNSWLGDFFEPQPFSSKIILSQPGHYLFWSFNHSLDNEIEIRNSQVKLFVSAIYYPSKEADYSCRLKTKILVPESWSFLSVRAVYRWPGVFKSEIVNQLADSSYQTFTRQESKVLLLSDKVKIEARPFLEVANGNLECSHGVVVSSIDKQRLNYLHGRGLSLKQAEDLLIKDFLAASKASFFRFLDLK